MAEGDTKGDWLPVSCRPPVECERSHSLPSSWLACRDDGVYLQNSKLGHLSISKGARQYQDKKTIERSLLFRLNNILKQIESNYNCLILPDDMTPSESHRKKIFFWKENYAFVKYVVENHKQLSRQPSSLRRTQKHSAWKDVKRVKTQTKNGEQ